MLRRTRLTAFVGMVAAVVLAGSPLAGADGAQNHVTAVNRTDDRVTTFARAAVTEHHGPTVTDENTAYASASCTDCRTVAAAVQVVAVDGSVSDFEPVNAAVALNESCTRCATYAYARQEIITVDGDLTITAAGQAALRALEDQIQQVTGSEEPFLEMGSDLDALTLQMVDIVRGEIERAGLRETGRTVRRKTDQGG
jgi:putative peptide zinc metalloprotease protein